MYLVLILPLLLFPIALANTCANNTFEASSDALAKGYRSPDGPFQWGTSFSSEDGSIIYVILSASSPAIYFFDPKEGIYAQTQQQVLPQCFGGAPYLEAFKIQGKQYVAAAVPYLGICIFEHVPSNKSFILAAQTTGPIPGQHFFFNVFETQASVEESGVFLIAGIELFQYISGSSSIRLLGPYCYVCDSFYYYGGSYTFTIVQTAGQTFGMLPMPDPSSHVHVFTWNASYVSFVPLQTLPLVDGGSQVGVLSTSESSAKVFVTSSYGSRMYVWNSSANAFEVDTPQVSLNGVSGQSAHFFHIDGQYYLIFGSGFFGTTFRVFLMNTSTGVFMDTGLSYSSCCTLHYILAADNANKTIPSRDQYQFFLPLPEGGLTVISWTGTCPVTPPPPPSPSPSSSLNWMIIGPSAGGGIALVALAIGIACYRRRRSGYQGLSDSNPLSMSTRPR